MTEGARTQGGAAHWVRDVGGITRNNPVAP